MWTPRWYGRIVRQSGSESANLVGEEAESGREQSERERRLPASAPAADDDSATVADERGGVDRKHAASGQAIGHMADDGLDRRERRIALIGAWPGPPERIGDGKPSLPGEDTQGIGPLGWLGAEVGPVGVVDELDHLRVRGHAAGNAGHQVGMRQDVRGELAGRLAHDEGVSSIRSSA